MGLASFILGIKDTDKCRWCNRAPYSEAHSPLPVCEKCFALAYGHPERWTRLLTEFEREGRAWVRRLQSRQTSTDVALAQADGAADLMAWQREVVRLQRAGKMEEALELRATLAKRQKEMTKRLQEVRDIVAELEREAAQ